MSLIVTLTLTIAAQFIRQLVDCYYAIGVHRKLNDLCPLSQRTTTLLLLHVFHVYMRYVWMG